MSTKTKFRRVTRKDAHEAVAAKENFKYNESAKGIWINTADEFISRGVLNQDDKNALEAHLSEEPGPAYVVYSYDTPIAVWEEASGWWLWEKTYTRTTTTHQTFVRRGIG